MGDTLNLSPTEFKRLERLFRCFRTVVELIADDANDARVVADWGRCVLEVADRLQTANELLREKKLTQQYALFVAEASVREFGYGLDVWEIEQISNSQFANAQKPHGFSQALHLLRRPVPLSMIESLERTANQLCNELDSIWEEQRHATRVVGMIQSKLDFYNLSSGHPCESVHPLTSP